MTSGNAYYWPIKKKRRDIAQRFCGERGIQTPGTDEPFTGFRVRPNRSLWHLSKVRVLSIAGAKVSINNELRLTKDEKKFVGVRFFRSNRYFLLLFACSSALCNRVARALMYLCSVKRERTIFLILSHQT